MISAISLSGCRLWAIKQTLPMHINNTYVSDRALRIANEHRIEPPLAYDSFISLSETKMELCYISLISHKSYGKTEITQAHSPLPLASNERRDLYICTARESIRHNPLPPFFWNLKPFIPKFQLRTPLLDFRRRNTNELAFGNRYSPDKLLLRNQVPCPQRYICRLSQQPQSGNASHIGNNLTKMYSKWIQMRHIVITSSKIENS